jgi:hypothetical protein
VHDIGNLTLTYDNSVLGNKSFPEKKGAAGQQGCYAGSKLFIEQQLVRCEDWTHKEILARREQIREWAARRWRVEKPKPPASPVPPPGTTEASPETAEERLLRLARQEGKEESLRAILSGIRRHPRYLYPRMQWNWRVIKVTPLQNKNETLFWVGVDLWVRFVYDNWAKFLGIPAKEAQATVGLEADHVLHPSEIDAFIDTLDRLVERIQEITEGSHLPGSPGATAGIPVGLEAGTDDIQDVLTRRFIPYSQLALCRVLYHAGERWVPVRELADEIGDQDTVAFGGVLGALGRRINSTGRFEQERPGVRLFFEIEERDGGTWYRMRPELREAIEGLPGLHEAVNWSLDEILTKYQEEWWPDQAAQYEQLGLGEET